MDEFHTLSNIDSQMQLDDAHYEQNPTLSTDEEENDDDFEDTDDCDSDGTKLKEKQGVSKESSSHFRTMPDSLLPFNKRSFVLPENTNALSTSSSSSKQHQWPAPDMNTCRWLSMYTTTSNHMVICHTEVDYVRNIRFGSALYIDNYHTKYGNTYEIHIHSVKLYITSTLLKINNSPNDLYPNDMVEKIKDAAAISYLLNLCTKNGQTVMTQLILLFHSINLLSLSTEQIDSIHNTLPTFVTHRLLAHMKKNYSWKSELYKISKIKTIPGQQTHIQLLFKASTYPRNKPLEYRKDQSFVHSRYVQEFYDAMQSTNTTTAFTPDPVTHVKWLFSAIVKSVIVNPPMSMFRLKMFDSTPNDIAEFLRASKSHPLANVILHTRAPFTGKEHFRLNCFKLNKIHVWINSMVFDKDQHKRVDLKQIIMNVAWGEHHIISFQYIHNQKLKQMHIETVKLIIRYILERRNFTKLAKDVARCPRKIKYDYIIF